MSFVLKCPNCGARPATEFRFGGEYRERPQQFASEQTWFEYIYWRKNVAGVQREWWYHRDGCGIWLLAERDTISNAVLKTEWP